MSWSPTARRNAVGAAARLLVRPEWRESDHGPELRQIVGDALIGPDRVDRLHAAYAVRFLGHDPPATLELIRERLLAEPESYVAAVLTNELAVLAHEMPDAVDAVLGDMAASDAWEARLTSGERAGADTLDPLVALALWLAIAHETAVATALVRGWCDQPLSGGVARRVLGKLRPWLALPASRAAERRRAFEFVLDAARELERRRAVTEAADAADLYSLADALVDQLYFASGAFGEQGGDNRIPIPAADGFAAEAFRVIDVLTEFRHPAIVHHMIKTLGHVAPANPRAAFLLVAKAISAGDAYTYDTMAADATITLIARYLADFREMVASDADMLTAIRRVLDAFVRVGWPAAVSLSYDLGDAFR